MRLRFTSVMIFVALLVAAIPGTAAAQSAQRCFPETGYCISGRMRSFWEQNGGLAVFGLPITPQQNEQIEGRATQVQWFERNRLELHPENSRPYDVLLGRLGATRAPVSAPSATQQPDCRFFGETGHNVCGEILSAWSAAGLNLDGKAGFTPAESLGLFGLPLTDLHAETLADGRSYQVQWFERGRFEVHPENQPPYRVLLGLLGSEARPIAQAAPQPVVAAAAPPVRMVIPAISLDQRVVAAGVDHSNRPIVLDHDIAWYNRSAYPGAGENIVFWGHVLRFRNTPQIPAPFARLKELKPGAEILLYDANGAEHRYMIRHQLWVTPDRVEYILPRGQELVTLVSCIGSQVISNGEVVDMSNRLITIAEPE